ncbi:hypothetical protein [Gordonia rhizosphera]|uniref:Uncharacterized protein n=1 Tax=Gordonia rhizosphera NBRC 16068 TaxID=1108045 RepID=K6WJ05_9ACTN|nr:hypothetical protein [Gordonia rhizosphera]GAB92152.1 hypothetical protein GORHZ_164_00460 [Gordonia rhizosphera NBRC 16068]
MKPNDNSTDTILVVMDGGRRAHSIVAQILASGRNVVITGPSQRALVPYNDASIHDHVLTVVSDPSDPAQIERVIERAADTLGSVIMIVDPGGLLADIDSADRRVA